MISAASSSKWVMNALGSEEAQVLERPAGLGIESWTLSTCRLCPGGCGIKVRLVDNRPVKIEGNPQSPISHGGLCPMGHSGLQVLFNPDRLKGPLKRVGARGEGQWQSISWEEAIRLLADRLKKMRAGKKPHHLLFLYGQMRGLLKRTVTQFMQAYGSPNLLSARPILGEAPAFTAMHGGSFRPAYDFANTRFLLSFGGDLLGTEGPPTWMAKMFGQMRQNRRGYRVKLIHADSRFSMTAAKADKWLPIRPGTAAALALGIAYILIMEERYDREYIQNYTFGFEDWTDDQNRRHRGLKSLILREYYPEKVSQITGVPVDDIIQVARNFAENKPSIALFGAEVSGHSNGFFTQIAVHALNALVGSLGRCGGIFRQPWAIPSSLPAVRPDNLAGWALQQPRADQDPQIPALFSNHDVFQLITNLENRSPYPIEVALIYGCNPVFEWPETARVQKALNQIPFIVSFSSFMDETTALADLVLPDHIYLEKWDLDFGVPYIPFVHVGLSQPILPPRFNTRNTGDVLLDLSRHLGNNFQSVLPANSYQQLVRLEAEALYRSRRGFIPTGQFEEFLFSYISRRGFRYQRARNFREFWDQFQKAGAWMDFPPPGSETSQRFETESRKFEFYLLSFSRQLLSYARKRNLSPEQATQDFARHYGLKLEEDLSHLPHYEPPQFQGAAAQYPLYLRPFQIVTLMEGEGANRPLLMEMAGYLSFVRWNSWAEISHETASRLGIKDRDWIWIESSVGKLKTQARVTKTVMPGIIFLPYGLGHSAYGRFAAGRGVNPNQITMLQKEVVSGLLVRNNTRVKVYPATDV